MKGLRICFEDIIPFPHAAGMAMYLSAMLRLSGLAPMSTSILYPSAAHFVMRSRNTNNINMPSTCTCFKPIIYIATSAITASKAFSTNESVNVRQASPMKSVNSCMCSPCRLIIHYRVRFCRSYRTPQPFRQKAQSLQQNSLLSCVLIQFLGVYFAVLNMLLYEMLRRQRFYIFFEF